MPPSITSLRVGVPVQPTKDPGASQRSAERTIRAWRGLRPEGGLTVRGLSDAPFHLPPITLNMIAPGSVVRIQGFVGRVMAIACICGERYYFLNCCGTVTMVPDPDQGPEELASALEIRRHSDVVPLHGAPDGVMVEGMKAKIVIRRGDTIIECLSVSDAARVVAELEKRDRRVRARAQAVSEIEAGHRIDRPASRADIRRIISVLHAVEDAGTKGILAQELVKVGNLTGPRGLGALIASLNRILAARGRVPQRRDLFEVERRREGKMWFPGPLLNEVLNDLETALAEMGDVEQTEIDENVPF